MQSFTVIIETVGSIGMLGAPEAYRSYSQGNVQGNRVYADVFIQMLKVSEKNWMFPENKIIRKDALLPFYTQLKQLEIEPSLKRIITITKDIRDGFSHAWTGVSENNLPEITSIGLTANDSLALLTDVITRLEAEKILD